MTASAPTAGQVDTDNGAGSPRLVAALVIGVLVTLYAFSLLLVARRMMGAFTADLPWPALLATALAAFAAITGMRILWRRTFPEPIVVDPWIGWGATLTLVLLAAGLSFPGEHPRDWFIWLPLLICDQVLRRHLFDAVGAGVVSPAKPQATLPTQQIVRTCDAAGRETIHATLRADFQAGQRNATVYVGFCPPLASMPEITVEPAAGPAADFKIVQAFAHGTRIDVRLAQVSIEQASVELNLVAKEVSSA